MRLALRASHMVTAPVLLDQDLAFRALLDVLVTLSPTFQQPLLSPRIPMYLPLRTTKPIVFLPTRHANRHEARSAPENPISRARFEGVDFGTVGGGAVPEFIGMATEVIEEGDLQQVFDLGGNKEPLYDWKGDRSTTFRLIAHTRQRELFGVGGGKEEMAKATVTISVATSEAVRLIDSVATNRAGFSILGMVWRSNGARERLANELS